MAERQFNPSAAFAASQQPTAAPAGGEGPPSAFQPIQPIKPQAAFDPTAEIDPLTQNRGTQRGYGTAILSELVKSYGFKRSSMGDWSWDMANIGEAFGDSPVWTTIDYLTLAAPVAKWGVGAARVARGVGAPAKAYQAGEISFRVAAKLAASGPPRTRIGRAFANVAGRTIDPQYAALIERHGADPAEVRGLYDVMARELQVEREALKRMREDQLRELGRLSPAEGADITEALERGIEPSAFVGRPDAARAYARTFEYRNALHQQAFDAGLISEATYARNLKKYTPRLYEEYEQATALTARAAERAASGGKGIQRASSRFAGRTAFDHPELNRILDPKIGVLEMARAADLVAKQQFAQRLAGSVIAKNADELIEHIDEFADVPAGKLLGVDPVEIAEIRRFASSPERGLKAAQELVIERRLGWRKIGDLFTSKIPGYVDRLPADFKDRYIDPAVMDDVVGIFKFWDEAKPTSTVMQMASRAYHGSMAFFRAGKTAYNPATHFRNYFGNIVFSHLAKGGIPTLFPRKGMQAFLEYGDDFNEAIRAGVVGSSFDNEVRAAVEAAYKNLNPARANSIAAGRRSALDFLGDSNVAKTLQAGAGMAERFYRTIDEVWKLDTFIKLRNRYVTRGLSREDAISRASLDVAKFMPQFSTHSPIGDVVRKGIPFASFTTEAMRVWKNALVERPVQAFFWTHAVDAASYAIGAASGYTPTQLEEYKALLPDFTANKKMMLLPFNVDGKPSFIDMSYLIPMANLSEAEQTENAFFGGIGALIDPSANPALNIAMAGTTGVDPFTGKPIEPAMTEKLTGTVVTDNPYLRRMVGMAEHMAKVMAPPLIPPGYAAANLIELVRGDVNPTTGLPYEPDVGRTIAANLFGMRAYEASLPSQLQNIQREEQKVGEKLKVWTDAYRRARANGDLELMSEAEANIKVIRETLEPGSGQKYFEDFSKKTAPGEYRGISTRMLEEAVQRGGRMPRMSAEDQQAMAELYARMRERRRPARRPRRGGR